MKINYNWKTIVATGLLFVTLFLHLSLSFNKVSEERKSIDADKAKKEVIKKAMKQSIKR